MGADQSVFQQDQRPFVLSSRTSLSIIGTPIKKIQLRRLGITAASLVCRNQLSLAVHFVVIPSSLCRATFSVSVTLLTDRLSSPHLHTRTICGRSGRLQSPRARATVLRTRLIVNVHAITIDNEGNIDAVVTIVIPSYSKSG